MIRCADEKYCNAIKEIDLPELLSDSRSTTEKNAWPRIIWRVTYAPVQNMLYFNFLWPDEVVEHVAEHGLGQDDFEYVVNHPVRRGVSRSSGLPAVWGYLEDGRYIIAVYEEIDDFTILPVTAYEVREPR